MGGLAAMLGGGAGGFGGLGGGAPPVADPETAYASQLTQLQVYIPACAIAKCGNHADVVFHCKRKDTCSSCSQHHEGVLKNVPAFWLCLCHLASTSSCVFCPEFCVVWIC